MTDDKTPEAAEAPAPITRARELPRRKMGLFDQEHFLNALVDRCQMHTKAERALFAGEATLMLTRDDMAALVCVADTLNLFNAYKAPDYVRREVARAQERKRGAKK